MEDLIKEEEFLVKKEYSQWRGFVVFYIVNVVFFITSSIVIEMIDDVIMRKPLSYICGILVIISPFLLIFRKRKNIFVSAQTILVAVFIHTLIYSVMLLGEQHLKDFNYGLSFNPLPLKIYFQALCGFIVYGLLCSGIILLIRWVIVRKLSVKPQSSSL